MIAISRLLRCDVSGPSVRHGRHTLLNTATAGPSRPAYRLPPPQFAIDSQFKFKVEAEAHPMDIGDLIMKVSMSNRHTVVLQAQGVAAAAVAVKGFIEANAPRSRTCHLVVSGAPPDEVGRRGGPSTVLWLSSYRSKDPNLFAHDSVETMVVSNHTKPAPLAGSISTSIEQGNVVRLQGAGPHCLKKMTEALAISGRHFSEGRQPRPDARRGPGLLVCWPRFVAARAPSAGHDRGPKGVVEIHVALEEHASSDSAEQERRRDLINREDQEPEAPSRSRIPELNVLGWGFPSITAAIPHHVGLVSCFVGARRGFRTLATKEMQQAEDRLRVTSSADPIDLAPFIRQRLGTPNRPNMVVLQALGANAVGRALRSVAYASSRRGQTIPLEVTLTGPPDDGIPDRGGGDLWIAVSRQGFRQRLRESQDAAAAEIQDIVVGHSTPAHKMAGAITNSLLQGKTVRMAGFSGAGIIKIANAITISSHHCETFDDVKDRGRIVTSVRTSLRAVNARGAPSEQNEDNHDESTGDDHAEAPTVAEGVPESSVDARESSVDNATEGGGGGGGQHKAMPVASARHASPVLRGMLRASPCRLAFSLPPPAQLARCPPFAMWSPVNFEYTNFCHPVNVCEILPKRFRKAGDLATMRVVGVPVRAGKALKTFIDIGPPPQRPPGGQQGEEEEGEASQPELWIHGRIQPKGGRSNIQAIEPVEIKLEKGWEMEAEAGKMADILTKEKKQVNLRIILSVVTTTTNVRLALIAELLARTGRLCNNAEGYENHELLARIKPTSIQFKRKGVTAPPAAPRDALLLALSDMKDKREKAGTITNPGVDFLLRLAPQPDTYNPLFTEWKHRPSVGDHRTMILKPAERDMAESDFQFRIKKEAELNEVVVLLAHTLRNQHGTVVLRGREEFERWAGMEAGNEIWIGAKISTRGHPADHRGWSDILVLPEINAEDLADRIVRLIGSDKNLKITGLGARSSAVMANAIAIASETCSDSGELICRADFTKVHVDPRNHHPVGDDIPESLDVEDLLTESGVCISVVLAAKTCQ
ncbi:Lysophosphatidylcholine acyltransferase 2 [Perkinsus olseni]|uniref:Lysophosphatidylcholine acyltransferase 2 n=1 Tax=Perkinsus olseni TaxID=32597 RepID=A0A7J6P1E4_PEROL|nr:Lysophosphatidylcholine acyltransferase 2 [Perkinsus olseni]